MYIIYIGEKCVHKVTYGADRMRTCEKMRKDVRRKERGLVSLKLVTIDFFGRVHTVHCVRVSYLLAYILD